jgi:hypothetical protein
MRVTGCRSENGLIDIIAVLVELALGLKTPDRKTPCIQVPDVAV